MEPAVRVQRTVKPLALYVACEERLAPNQDLSSRGDRDLATRQGTARGAQLLARGPGRCSCDLGSHLREAVAGVDRQSAGQGLVYESGRDGAAPIRTASSPPRSAPSRSSLESWVETSETCVAPKPAMSLPSEVPGRGSATVALASRHRNTIESPPT